MIIKHFSQAVTSLQQRYHVLTPVIDGHGGNAAEPFVSIEIEAHVDKLLQYINSHCKSKVFAIGGLFWVRKSRRKSCPGSRLSPDMPCWRARWSVLTGDLRPSLRPWPV